MLPVVCVLSEMHVKQPTNQYEDLSSSLYYHWQTDKSVRLFHSQFWGQNIGQQLIKLNVND